MSLFEPIWKDPEIHNDPKKEKKALEYILKLSLRGDRKRVNEIALQAPSALLRLRAAEGVQDREVLKEIALRDEDEEVIACALAKIPDDDFLADYAVKTENNGLTARCIKNLRSQKAIAAVAGSTRDPDRIRACLDRLTEEELLADFAVQADSCRFSKICIQKLKSHPLIASVAVRVHDPDVIRLCLDRLEGDMEGEIADILAKSDEPMIRKFLSRREETLKQKALTEPNISLRKELVSGLKDPKTLWRAATEDENVYVRMAACERLKALKSEIPADWWESHVDESTEDQRWVLWIRQEERDGTAAEKIAEDLYARKSYTRALGSVKDSYVLAHCPAQVIELLEKKLSAGDRIAGEVLIDLYRSEQLNPRLAQERENGRKRLTGTHTDGNVQECGYPHRDQINYSILPM